MTKKDMKKMLGGFGVMVVLMVISTLTFETIVNTVKYKSLLSTDLYWMYLAIGYIVGKFGSKL